jgi:hypothetical protein
LLIIAIKGAIVGGDPTILLRRWRATQAVEDLAGTEFILYSDTEYIPMSIASDVPAPGAPYQSPRIYAIALSVANERALGISHYSVVLKDGDLYGLPVDVVGPRLRQICTFPNGEQGGGVGCCGPEGCVGGPETPPTPGYYYGYEPPPPYYYDPYYYGP